MLVEPVEDDGTDLEVAFVVDNECQPAADRVEAGFGRMRNDLHGDWTVASHVSGTTEVLTIHPANDFWTFQAIETAIFGALPLPLLIGSIYWVRRRIA